MLLFYDPAVALSCYYPDVEPSSFDRFAVLLLFFYDHDCGDTWSSQCFCAEGLCSSQMKSRGVSEFLRSDVVFRGLEMILDCRSF